MNAREPLQLFTVGHSTLASAELLALLEQHHVDAVADVRSIPASSFAPQHDATPLAAALRGAGIGYVGLPQLGGRPTPPHRARRGDLLDDDGHVDYGRIATSEPYQAALRRLAGALGRMRVAVLCAEAEATTCHRRLLVARSLVEPTTTPLAAAEDLQLVHLHSTATTREPASALLGVPDVFGDLTWRSARPLRPLG